MNRKKITALLCVVMLCMSLFVACSKGGKNNTVISEKSAEQIDKAYDEAINDGKVDELEKTSDFVADSFTTFDFSFRTLDNTVAFNLPEDSFVKLTLTAAYFNFTAPGHEVETFDGEFKTAKGLSISASVQDFADAYKLEPTRTLYLDKVNQRYEYPTGWQFVERLSAGFATDGKSEDFVQLSSKELQKILRVRDSNAEGMYFDPELINEALPDYQTIVIMDLCTDDSGALNNVVFYRFDK